MDYFVAKDQAGDLFAVNLGRIELVTLSPARKGQAQTLTFSATSETDTYQVKGRAARKVWGQFVAHLQRSY